MDISTILHHHGTFYHNDHFGSLKRLRVCDHIVPDRKVEWMLAFHRMIVDKTPASKVCFHQTLVLFYVFGEYPRFEMHFQCRQALAWHLLPEDIKINVIYWIVGIIGKIFRRFEDSFSRLNVSKHTIFQRATNSVHRTFPMMSFLLGPHQTKQARR